jgi:hypothetical protein
MSSDSMPERPVSGVERLWLAADRLAPPFVNQMVIEGREGGPHADLERWGEALAEVARLQPGCRLRLAGSLRRTRWVADGPIPRVVEVDGSLWDGVQPEGAPFLMRPLDPVRGPVVELLIVRGTPPRVVLRTHHAAMDGMGTMLAAEGLFSVLRGDAPDVAGLGGPIDLEIARESGRSAEEAPPLDLAPPFDGVSAGIEAGVTWRRRRFEGSPRRLVARLATRIARVVGAPIRVDVPVDLRRMRPGLRSNANLTGLVRLPVAPTQGSVQVAADLAGRVEAGEASDFVLAADRFRNLPLALLESGGRSAARAAISLGRFGTTATLSNLGRIEPGRLTGGGFAARRVFFVPPGSPGLPLFVALSGDPEGVEICASAPMGLAADGRLDRLLDRLMEGLYEGE